MNTKHTPGPWTFNPGKGPFVGEILGGGFTGKLFQLATVNHFPGFQEESDHNARLIAAAPEMLEALKEVNEFLKNRAFMGTIRETVSKAIAKAEGRE